jgi:hypothetical protein
MEEIKKALHSMTQATKPKEDDPSVVFAKPKAGDPSGGPAGTVCDDDKHV